MDNAKKNELMEHLAHELDITPDMYRRMIRVVDGLQNHLQNRTPGTRVYKQGSMKLGTAVRPYKGDKDADFDIDLVVQYLSKREDTSPELLKSLLGDSLKNSDYGFFLDEEGRKCWTLNYDANNPSRDPFHIDLCPAVDESMARKSKIHPGHLRDSAIAITKIKDKKIKPHQYDWDTSNPEGYAKWFNGLTDGVYRQIKINDRQRVYARHQGSFADINSVADEYTRTPLQRVVQLLKRHRDVAYANQKNSDDKPASIIITTLVGRMVEALSQDGRTINDTYQLLNFVLDNITQFAKFMAEGKTSDASSILHVRAYMTRVHDAASGKMDWKIPNPANSEENLADRWNETPAKAAEFFKWVAHVKKDLIDVLESNPIDVKKNLQHALGPAFIIAALSRFSFEPTKPKVALQSNQVPQPHRA